MDLKLEAQRVMAVALGKMYNSRLQRGGIRLHRSLLLSLVLRGARDIYLNVRGGPGGKAEPRAEAMELEAGEQRGPVRGSEGLQPRGSEGLQPRGSEGLQPRGSEGLQPRGSEGLQPRGSEGLQPRGEERLQPRECIRCGRYPSVPAAPQRSPAETPIGTGCLCPAPEPREAGKSPGSSRSRKRRKGRDPGQPPEAVPSKRARLEEESQHRAAAPENPGICSLAAVFSGLLRPGQSEGSPGHICRDRGPSELGMWLPAIVAC